MQRKEKAAYSKGRAAAGADKQSQLQQTEANLSKVIHGKNKAEGELRDLQKENKRMALEYEHAPPFGSEEDKTKAIFDIKYHKQQGRAHLEQIRQLTHIHEQSMQKAIQDTADAQREGTREAHAAADDGR